MDIFNFSKVENMLPPFKEYLDFMFNGKQMPVVARKSGSLVMPFKIARERVFHPTTKTEKDTKDLVIALTKEVIPNIIKEMRDPKKRCWENLSESGSEYSFVGCGGNYLIGYHATNDIVESALGGCTRHVQDYGRINLASAAACSDADRNNVFNRVVPTKRKASEVFEGDGKPARKKKGAKRMKMGMFHGFSKPVQEIIVKLAIKDAPATREYNREQLEKLLKEKLEKEELKRKAGFEKASNAMLDIIMHYNMYETDRIAKQVRGKKGPREILRTLLTKKDQYGFLKDNINCRVRGFGWKQFAITWTKNKKE